MRKVAVFLLPAFALCAHALDLNSTDFVYGQRLDEAQVFQGFGCTGGNMSPQLSWTSPPAGTKSFAITMFDPEAPTDSGWWHWIAYDLPASLRSLPAGAGKAGSLPAGAKQGRNDFGGYEYGGACPPEGHTPHRYVFKVYALGVGKLPVPADASAALISFMLNANKLAAASITARYGR